LFKRIKKTAFSLIELSLVLVAIATIITGVTVGAKVLDNAKLSKVMTEVEALTNAVMNFKLSFNSLPGDIADADDYFGSSCAGGDSDKCNGDGNGAVLCSSDVDVNEVAKVYHHLYLAKIIDQVIDDSSFGAGDVDLAGDTCGVGNTMNISTNPGVNAPALSMEKGTIAFSAREKFIIGAGPRCGYPMFALFTPNQAKKIDNKLDDGVRNAGIVTSGKGLELSGSACENASDSSAYNLSSDVAECYVSFYKFAGGYDALNSQNIDTSESNTVAQDCVVTGGWCEWSAWGSCDPDTGLETRTRSCGCPAAQNGGAACSGATSETRTCSVDGIWCAWGAWGSCDSNTGTQTRSRTCGCPTAKNGGSTCSGSSTDTGNCLVNGGWCSWSSWSACSGGTKTRTRTCACPTAKNGGATCSGSSSETSTDGCAINGGWCAWGSWGSCSSSGYKTRTRSCSCPSPSNGGSNCSGSSSETTTCPVNGGWCSWGSWGSCNESSGYKYRYRSCSCPSPKNGGSNCSGSTSQSTGCNVDGCSYSGQSCTCSNTGWSGTCNTGPHKPALYCQCD